ncbi:hypothetical protein [Rhodoferax sp.]|uniref:hypothetical protein n=1 Tax=Rhodoferax sp. TaxID=50421 RepID=UPI0037847DC1
MTFKNEIPSAEDIQRFDLPYGLDLEKPIEHRRTWLADRERDIYLTGPGATGNQAHDDNVKTCFDVYLGKSKLKVIVEPSRTLGDFRADPYFIHWPALLEIWVGTIEVIKLTSSTPDVPHPLLQGRSLNEFVVILKEAVSENKAGYYTRFISAPITVSFGF